MFLISLLSRSHSLVPTPRATIIQHADYQHQDLDAQDDVFLNVRPRILAFEYPWVVNRGGAFTAGNMTSLRLTSCRFIGCGTRANGSYGGAIWAGNFNVFYANRTSFLNCYAGNAGGAVYFVTSAPVITFTNCQFTNNTVNNGTATATGSALFFERGSANATFINSSITNCSASGDSALFYDGGYSLTITGGYFHNNAGHAAGCLLVRNTSRFDLRQSIFDENFAYGTGSGALTLFEVPAARLYGCHFIVDKDDHPDTTTVYLSGVDSKVRIEACFFDTVEPDTLVHGGRVANILSTTPGDRISFWLPICFDLDNASSVSFPPGINPLAGMPVFNCVDDRPPRPWGSPSATFTPAATTTRPLTPIKTHSPIRTLTRVRSRSKIVRTPSKSPTPTHTPVSTRLPPPSLVPPVTATPRATQRTSTPHPTFTPPKTAPSPSISASSEPTTESSGGLRVEAIIGIAAGSGAVLIAVVVVVVCCVKRRRKPPSWETMESSLLAAESPRYTP
jgi:hypothetical protein